MFRLLIPLVILLLVGACTATPINLPGNQDANTLPNDAPGGDLPSVSGYDGPDSLENVANPPDDADIIPPADIPSPNEGPPTDGMDDALDLSSDAADLFTDAADLSTNGSDLSTSDGEPLADGQPGG